MLISKTQPALPDGFGVLLRHADTAHQLSLAMVDEVDFGLMACTDGGRILYANRAARDELAHGEALACLGNTLRVASGTRAPLEQALLEAIRQGRRRVLRLGNGSSPLLACVLPLPGHDAALVMLGRREPCTDLGLEMLSQLHGLTAAERRVLAALLAESTPRRIAADHGVALSTVRSQIKAIREKFGVRTIDGLLARAASMPPISPSWRRLGFCAPASGAARN